MSAQSNDGPAARSVTDRRLVAVYRLLDALADSYRDLLGGSLDAYMSMVSNRLNDVMKQLTVIATVFLPLTFLTGAAVRTGINTERAGYPPRRTRVTREG